MRPPWQHHCGHSCRGSPQQPTASSSRSKPLHVVDVDFFSHLLSRRERDSLDTQCAQQPREPHARHLSPSLVPQGSDGFSFVLHGSQLFLVSRGCGQIGSLSWSRFCRRAGILLWGITEIRESPLGHEWRNHAVRLASPSEWQDGNPSSLQ